MQYCRYVAVKQCCIRVVIQYSNAVYEQCSKAVLYTCRNAGKQCCMQACEREMFAMLAVLQVYSSKTVLYTCSVGMQASSAVCMLASVRCLQCCSIALMSRQAVLYT
jgi:hypothetical protein